MRQRHTLPYRIKAGLLIMALAMQGALAQTFVYVANYHKSTISVFQEDHSGTLRAIQEIRTPSGPESVVIDKKGFVITADSLAHAISAYRVNTKNGHLSQTSVKYEAVRANPLSVTTTPHGHFVYVANSGDNTVGIYHLGNDGTLTKVGLVREAPTARPYAVTLTPNGRYVYVANFGNATIAFYKRELGHGHLQALGIFHEPRGDGPYGMSTGPDGRFLYVADFRANVLVVLAIGTDGGLSLQDRIAEPFDHHPDSLVIDPSGRYLFVANTSANDVSIFHINQSDGRLRHVGHVPTGSYPFSLTLDAAARFVFTVNFGAGTISRYRLDHHSGMLSPIGTTAETPFADPYSIAALTIPENTAPKAPITPEGPLLPQTSGSPA